MPTWLSWVQVPSPALDSRREPRRPWPIRGPSGFLDFLAHIASDRSGDCHGRHRRHHRPRTTATERRRRHRRGRAEEQPPSKLKQTVEIKDIGPCKKHIKVTVDREAIDARLDEKYSELRQERPPHVPGFRPGKAPRKIIEQQLQERRRATRSSGEVLMASLEQLAEEQDIAPLARRTSTRRKIEIPEEGPFVYEFDIEVRPEFDLPDYKGLKLKRPMHDLHRRRRRPRSSGGSWSRTASSSPRRASRQVAVGRHHHRRRRPPTTAARSSTRSRKSASASSSNWPCSDGVAEDFGKKMTAPSPATRATVDIELSDAVADPTLRGKTVAGHVRVKDVKTVRLPELTPELLDAVRRRTTEDQFDELIRVVLERRLEYTQRQSARAAGARADRRRRQLGAAAGPARPPGPQDAAAARSWRCSPPA